MALLILWNQQVSKRSKTCSYHKREENNLCNSILYLELFLYDLPPHAYVFQTVPFHHPCHTKLCIPFSSLNRSHALPLFLISLPQVIFGTKCYYYTPRYAMFPTFPSFPPLKYFSQLLLILYLRYFHVSLRKRSSYTHA